MLRAHAEMPEKAFGRIAFVALIALPFLFPFAEGPSVNVQQQLATWACVAVLSGLAPIHLPCPTPDHLARRERPRGSPRPRPRHPPGRCHRLRTGDGGRRRLRRRRHGARRLAGPLGVGPPRGRPAQRPPRPAPVLRPGRRPGPLDHHPRTRPGLRQPAPAQPVRLADQHGADRGLVAARGPRSPGPRRLGTGRPAAGRRRRRRDLPHRPACNCC